MIELDILETQENQLRFHHFDGEEAYQLGTFMAEYAKEHGITIASVSYTHLTLPTSDLV